MRTILITSCLLLYYLFPPTGVAQDTNHAQLLPESTVAAFSILDYTGWRAKVKQSGMASYFSDENVRRMVGDIANFSDDLLGVWSLLRSNFVRNNATGQVTFALVQDGGPLFVLLMDCRDADSAKKCAAEISAKSKAENSALMAIANDATVFATNDSVFIQDNFKFSGKPLADSERFRSTVSKSTAEVRRALFWLFIDPISMSRNKTGQPMFPGANLHFYDFAKLEGFDSIQSIGGAGTVNSNGRKMEMIGHIYAKQPYSRGMRILDLENARATNKPKWLLNGLSHGFLNVRTDCFLESCSTVFDRLVGEGEEGIFPVVLDDLKNDPKGPRVDIEQEIFKNLQAPLYFANTAIGKNQSKRLFGIRVSNLEAVRKAFEKIYAGDSRAKKIEGLNCDAWKVLPLEESDSDTKRAYVVALKNGFLLSAPNVETINKMFSWTGSTSHWFTPTTSKALGSESSMGYACDLNHLVHLKHMQLKQGRVDGMLGSLFRTARISSSLEKYDRSQWPNFESLPRHIKSQFRFLASSNSDGWKFAAEIAE